MLNKSITFNKHVLIYPKPSILLLTKVLNISNLPVKKASAYGQEIKQSNNVGQPMIPRGRAAEHTDEPIKVKPPSLSAPSR